MLLTTKFQIELIEDVAGLINKKFSEIQESDYNVLIEKCCRKWNITFQDLQKDDRHREIVMKRIVLMTILKENYHLKLTDIGKIFGGKAHTSVIYGINQAKDWLKINDEIFTNTYKQAMSVLYGG